MVYAHELERDELLGELDSALAENLKGLLRTRPVVSVMSPPVSKEAIAAALRLLQEGLQDIEGPEKSPPVRDVWDRYFREEARHLRSSQRTADSAKAIRDVVGADGVALFDRPIMTITAEVVEEVREALKARITRFNRPPKPATLNRHFISLRRMMNWAVEQKVIPYSPLMLKLEPERNVRQTVIRTEEDFQRLLRCCDPYNRALCLLFFDSGLRRMEGVTLRRDQVTRRPDGTAAVSLSGNDTKNGRPRCPRLTKRTLEALDALPQRGPYFFSRRDGKKPLAVRFLYELFQRAVARSGLQPAPGENLCWHVLRSSFVAVRRSVDHWNERQIMAAGGWVTRSAFDRYGWVDETEIDDAVAAVEKRISAGGVKPNGNS